MTRRTAPQPDRRRPGFTMVELLTSVAIIAIMMIIIFPVVGALKGGSRIEAGLNTVSLASDVARAWSTASLPQADLGSDPVAPVPFADYSGTAAIFCPTGEVRIVINDQRATTNGAPVAANGSNALESLGVNAYIDYRVANRGRRDLDYIAIPQGVGLAGIYRDNSGAGVRLIAPPFAIAFNRDGQMIQGSDTAGTTPVIYYDADFDGSYTGLDRGSVTGGSISGMYDPVDWDGGPGANNENPDATALVRHLPFEAIETVVGVIIYDQDEAEAAGFDFSGGGVYAVGSAGYDWLRANGTPLFFSPNTGVAMRDEGKE